MWAEMMLNDDPTKQLKVAAIGIKDIQSDNCGGQNRNRSVLLIYLYAAKKFKVHVSHRFLKKGQAGKAGR